jgi:hypothetical protein
LHTISAASLPCSQAWHDHPPIIVWERLLGRLRRPLHAALNGALHGPGRGLGALPRPAPGDPDDRRRRSGRGARPRRLSFRTQIGSKWRVEREVVGRPGHYSNSVPSPAARRPGCVRAVRMGRLTYYRRRIARDGGPGVRAGLRVGRRRHHRWRSATQTACDCGIATTN